ncbi:TPA: hypothetical protein QH074_004333 [Enterobacter hormaechei subsp. steigerwaltii]|nr:hypothetical protein [Enterobacter hormaechei subsp. steigerwaltii]
MITYAELVAIANILEKKGLTRRAATAWRNAAAHPSTTDAQRAACYSRVECKEQQTVTGRTERRRALQQRPRTLADLKQGQSLRAHERRLKLCELWNKGLSREEICKAIDISNYRIPGMLSEMRQNPALYALKERQ